MPYKNIPVILESGSRRVFLSERTQVTAELQSGDRKDVTETGAIMTHGSLSTHKLDSLHVVHSLTNSNITIQISQTCSSLKSEPLSQQISE